MSCADYAVNTSEGSGTCIDVETSVEGVGFQV